MPLYSRYLFSIPRLCDWINISQAAPRPFFSLTNWGGGKESFRPARRTINIKVIPLEVLQSGAPYVHCQTRALVPFLSLPRLTLAPYLSIHPSRLICCTICAAVISRTPHVLPFTPLLSLFPSWFWLSPSHQARPPPPARRFDWLECVPRWSERAATQKKKRKKNVSGASCHTLRPAITQQSQGQLTNSAFISPPKRTPASVNVITSHVACTRSLSITPSKQTISPLVLKSVQPRVWQFESSAAARYWSVPVITATSHSAG